MTAVQRPEEADTAPNGSHMAKRGSPTSNAGTLWYFAILKTDRDPARRNSTILNPRSYVAEELSKQAPVFVGSTKFAPLPDAKNILVTGGAGFM